MTKVLKHLSLINDYKIPVDCPGMGVQEYELEVFRWYRTDWDPETNFLPNALEPRPPRQNLLEGDKCGYCGMSFYDDLKAAQKKFKSFSERTRLSLGHTHIYKGVLQPRDGIGSPIKSNHINFYDYDGVQLHIKFTEVCNLSA